MAQFKHHPPGSTLDYVAARLGRTPTQRNLPISELSHHIWKVTEDMAKDIASSDGLDETRETIDGFRTLDQSLYPDRYPESHTGFKYEGPTAESVQQMRDVVHHTEAVSLFHDAVDTAREGIQQSLAGSDKVGDLKLKLTVDLSHTHLQDIPDEVVSILKRDVERYGLCIEFHSAIRFAEFDIGLSCPTTRFGTSRTNFRNAHL